MGAIVIPGQFGRHYDEGLTQSVNQTASLLDSQNQQDFDNQTALGKFKLLAQQAQDNHQQASAMLQQQLLQNQMGQAGFQEWQGQAANRAHNAEVASNQGDANLNSTILNNLGKNTSNALSDVNLKSAAQELAEQQDPNNVGLRNIDRTLKVAKAYQGLQQGVATIDQTNAEANNLRALTASKAWEMNPKNPDVIARHVADGNALFTSNPDLRYALLHPEGKQALLDVVTKMGYDPQISSSLFDAHAAGLQGEIESQQASRKADIDEKKHSDVIRSAQDNLDSAIKGGNGAQAAAASNVLAQLQLKGTAALDPDNITSLAQNQLRARGVQIQPSQDGQNRPTLVPYGQSQAAPAVQLASPGQPALRGQPIAPQGNAPVQPQVQSGSAAASTGPGPGQALVQDQQGRKFIIDKATQQVIRQVP